MKPHDQPHGLCSVDPITLTGLALAGLGGFAASSAFSGSSAPAAPTPVTPPAPTTAAPPAQNPVGSAKPQQGSQPSFFGAAATPNQSGGGKTLLGQ